MKKNREFQRVYRTGKRFGAKTMLLIALPQKSGVRIGFSIGKKVGNAVVRNRIKRRMRECVRVRIADMKPCRLVFVAREEAASEAFASIRKTMYYLMSKADVFTNE